MTPEQLERLMSDLPDLSQELAAAHLTDEEMIGYAMELISHDDTLRIDAHLASCIQCASAMEHLLEVEQAWRGEPGQNRLTALHKRVLASQPSLLARLIARLAQALRQAQQDWQKERSKSRLTPLVTATSQKRSGQTLLEWQTEDGQVEGHIILEPNGDWTIRFFSDNVDLEGTGFWLLLDQSQREDDRFKREVILQRVSLTEVEAELVIPPDRQPADIGDLDIQPFDEQDI